VTNWVQIRLKLFKTDPDLGGSNGLIQSASIFEIITQVFILVKEHGQCETLPYRMLVGGGGCVWVQTKAALLTARRGSNKGNSVCCKHTIIT
jgi:PAS domain